MPLLSVFHAAAAGADELEEVPSASKKPRTPTPSYGFSPEARVSLCRGAISWAAVS